MASCSKALSYKNDFFFSGWNIYVKFMKPYFISFKCISENCCHKPCAMLGFMTSRGEDFDLGPETRLDHSELFV